MRKIYLYLREIKHQVFKTVFGFSSTCSHSPSCSSYMKIAIKKDGVIVGGIQGLKKIMSCTS